MLAYGPYRGRVSQAQSVQLASSEIKECLVGVKDRGSCQAIMVRKCLASFQGLMKAGVDNKFNSIIPEILSL